MFSKIFKKLLKFLPCKNIYRDSDNTLYLTRYYIFRKPFKWLPSIYIHCFHESDEDYELHSHPWNYSFSFILSGSYAETVRQSDDSILRRIMKAGSFNYVPKNKFHRIELLDDKVWTVFVSGQKVSGWGFWHPDSGIYRCWQEHALKKKLLKDNEKRKPVLVQEKV